VDDEEEGEIDGIDPEIHCFRDTSSFPHLSQSAYEESLMDRQFTEGQLPLTKDGTYIAEGNTSIQYFHD
jgi:hypothetical protein